MYQRDLEANFGKENQKIGQLLEDTEFMLTYNLVSLAKNHNFFGQMDKYMKELARILIDLPHSHLKDTLEYGLSKEVCITSSYSSVIDHLEYKNVEHEFHHNVLAMPEFQFMPRSYK